MVTCTPPTTSSAGVEDDLQVPRLEAGAAGDGGTASPRTAARARSDHSRNASSIVVQTASRSSGSPADRRTRRERPLGDGSRPSGSASTQAGPADPVAELPAAGRRPCPAGTGIPITAAPWARRSVLHPAGESGADPAAEVVGMDGCVAAGVAATSANPRSGRPSHTPIVLAARSKDGRSSRRGSPPPR